MSTYNVGACHVDDFEEKEVKKIAKRLLKLKCSVVSELVEAAEGDLYKFSPELLEDIIHWLRLNAYNRKKKKYIQAIRKLRFFREQSAENMPRCVRMPGTKVNEVDEGSMVVFYKDNEACQPRFYYGEVIGLDPQGRNVIVKPHGADETAEQVVEPLRLVATGKECSFFSDYSPNTLEAWLGLYFALRNRFFATGITIIRHDAWNVIGAMRDEITENETSGVETELAAVAEG